MGSIPLWQYATHTIKSTHHQAFWNALDDALPAELKARVASGGDLRALWLAQSAEAAPAEKCHPNPLVVPYDYQGDNVSGYGYRECATSSCGMVAMYWGAISDVNNYSRVRAKHGDTTDIQAHIAALRSLGLEARFVTNGNAKLLEQEITAGRPVPTGWLHKGPVTRPGGGGHWSVAIGFATAAFIHHDPNGEAALGPGGYLPGRSGRGVSYSRTNWIRRWEADGPNTGWALLIQPR
jgi:hypothetical protein